MGGPHAKASQNGYENEGNSHDTSEVSNILTVQIYQWTTVTVIAKALMVERSYTWSNVQHGPLEILQHLLFVLGQLEWLATFWKTANLWPIRIVETPDSSWV